MKKSSDLKPRQTEGNLSAIQHLRGQRHLDEDGLRVASGMSRYAPLGLLMLSLTDTTIADEHRQCLQMPLLQPSLSQPRAT